MPKLLAGTEVSPRSLAEARVVVLGIGRFGGGLGVARWLASQGASVLASDRLPRAELGASPELLEADGVELLLGGHAGIDWKGVDLLVVNPAIPPQAPIVCEAREAGVTLSSEIALLMERWPGPMIGVTGSNGKSTTVGLTAAMLRALGRPAMAGGNLGGSLLRALDEVDASTTAVLELSSFMLEALPGGLPPVDVAVITNLTPNHLDRHGSMQSYAHAKAQVLRGARAAVLRADQSAVVDLAVDAPFDRRWFADGERPPANPSLWVDAHGALRDGRPEPRLAAGSFALPGRMNLLNLAAAALATEALLGIECQLDALAPRVVADYLPPPHRLAQVAEVHGVRWLNDSVSTTPESTAASLEAVNARCVLIAGGRDKGLDAEPLIEAARRHALRVLTVGEQAESLAQALNRAGIPAEQVDTISAAVRRAAVVARPGEVVLLSPGYSSHDQFAHFEARAACFEAEVGRHAAQGNLAASRQKSGVRGGGDRKLGDRTAES
ncbi:MAG: UDP-N-acetylmuramoylalanine--D-glutamate ligase [Planctomycetota bacterium]|nr:MAG: UDP-N-acetylmuramoylalanine--D-glutamate ligase [Planctomycetota bacterium]